MATFRGDTIIKNKKHASREIWSLLKKIHFANEKI